MVNQGPANGIEQTASTSRDHSAIGFPGHVSRRRMRLSEVAA
jgi:hypothetical protein